MVLGWVRRYAEDHKDLIDEMYNRAEEAFKSHPPVLPPIDDDGAIHDFSDAFGSFLVELYPYWKIETQEIDETTWFEWWKGQKRVHVVHKLGNEFDSVRLADFFMSFVFQKSNPLLRQTAYEMMENAILKYMYLQRFKLLALKAAATKKFIQEQQIWNQKRLDALRKSTTQQQSFK
jgi:hypothetical protein